jgi:hypothetical protein
MSNIRHNQRGGHSPSLLYFKFDPVPKTLCHRCLFFTVQQRLTSPDLQHSEKLQEGKKRNSLHQEKHQEVK